MKIIKRIAIQCDNFLVSIWPFASLWRGRVMVDVVRGNDLVCHSEISFVQKFIEELSNDLFIVR
jgi:hypothetical protein